ETINQAVQVKRQAATEFLPKLSASYGYTYLNKVQKRPESMLPVTTPGFGVTGWALIPEQTLNSRDNYQLKLSAKQPVFTGFALISSYKLAKLGIDQSKMEVELEKLDLALKVKEAYYDILIADKAVEVAEKDVVSRKSHVEVVRNFYDVGMIPINDLLKAEVELANSQQYLVTALNGARLARAAFNIVLSRDIHAPLEVKDMPGFEPERGDFGTYQEKALKNRPEMKVINIGILSAEQEIRLAQSKFYPEIGVTFDYIKEGDEPDVSGSPFHESSRYEIGAALTWTFWEWGKTLFSVKEKMSRRREMIQTKKALEDSIRFELEDALLGLKTAEENIPTTKKAVKQGEENLRVNEERYKAQVTTITEVLDAQTLLTRARVEYYNALYAHRLAKARLLRATGTY
ncbi:MAG: TolC family protein, partial [Deltaproteobacteria bacterium]|nr:TolC family protein [Deltaproteobacteria bacterium]